MSFAGSPPPPAPAPSPAPAPAPSLIGPQISTLTQFVQDTPSDTWTIAHNMGMYPVVDVYVQVDGMIQKMLPHYVKYLDANTCEVGFTLAHTGFATVV